MRVEIKPIWFLWREWKSTYKKCVFVRQLPLLEDEKPNQAGNTFKPPSTRSFQVCVCAGIIIIWSSPSLWSASFGALHLGTQFFCTRKHGISNSYAFNVRPLLDFGRRCALLLVLASHCLRHVDALSGSENSALCKLPKCLPIGMKN
jgi:hypothetical protein